MDLYHKYFLVGNGWGVDGFAIPHVPKGVFIGGEGVLIGGEGCSHRWRRVSSSVADDIFIGGKVQVKVTCQEKRMEGQSETPV